MKRLALLFVLAAAPALAQVAMPDPTQIAGMALPAPELPDGTVSVRLVREQLGNNITGHDVKVVAGGTTKTGKTDDSGRAIITGLPAGADATAEAVVSGERVVSKPFSVPEKGGLRVILIAGLAELIARREKEEEQARTAPVGKGIVVFGGDSRIILEFQDDSLQAFYLLDIVNTARTRVDPGGPLIIDLPRGAAGAAIMEGSFPGATVSGDRVTVTAPFPPGTTSVRVGFRLDYSGAETTIAQKFPARLERISVILEKVGDVHMQSPQFTDHRDVRADDGAPFILANGGSLPAGQELAVHLTGLPAQSTWPRDVALALGLGILAIGAWMAFTGGKGDDERRRLVARRDSLYGELVKIEEQHRAGRIDAGRYHSKRQHLVAELERVYGELDAAPESDRAA